MKAATEYPRNADEWRALLAAKAPMVDAWMTAGLAAEKASLTSLLRVLVDEAGLPGNEHFLGLLRPGNHIFNTKHQSRWSDATSSRVKFTHADLQMAVALALSYDGPAHGLREISPDPAWLNGFFWRRIDRKGAFEVRSTWNEADQALLGAAIELWCPQDLLADHGPGLRSESHLPEATQSPKSPGESPSADPEAERIERINQRDRLEGRRKQAARLMMLVGSYSGRPEAIDAFADARLDMDFFAHWSARPETPNDLQVNYAWVKENTKELPLPLVMLSQGAIRCSARLMSLTSCREMRNIAMQFITAVRANDQIGIDGSVLDVLNQLAKQKSWVAHPESVQGMAELADALHEKAPSFQSQVAQIRLFNKFLTRETWLDSTDVDGPLARLLALPGHGGRPGMASVLGDWSVHVKEEADAWAASRQFDYSARMVQSGRNRANSGTIESLMQLALDHQSAHFLGALEPQLFDKSCPHHSLTQSVMLQSCCVTQESPKPHSHPERFRQTLDLLASRGLDFQGEVQIVEDIMGRHLLHWIATSRNQTQLANLQVALSLGCNPGLANDLRELPQDLIEDAASKERWIEVVRSFTARQAAAQAMNDINEAAGLPPVMASDDATTTKISPPAKRVSP